MRQSFLSKLVGSNWFTNLATEMILSEAMNRPCSGFPEGLRTSGKLVDFEFTAPLVFKPVSSEGLVFRVSFTGSAVASGLCSHGGESEYSYARDTLASGEIKGELPHDVLITEGFKNIMNSTLLEINFASLDIDDKNPTEGPPEKFAGEA